ncbi:hypothetical protein BDV95DRAFT_141265 [Massariosphaeria phaeospora]|uniref:F-box domain-containing protein n=1 Tax=Massariosphaeria phaeospora TaxID=100035 RepID=A0A7C8MUE5_9PLEO|nr:hypothetical protein BDV95DRAFT_141265 [Massariosphaeria phaeospora]
MASLQYPGLKLFAQPPTVFDNVKSIQLCENLGLRDVAPLFQLQGLKNLELTGLSAWNVDVEHERAMFSEDSTDVATLTIFPGDEQHLCPEAVAILLRSCRALLSLHYECSMDVRTEISFDFTPINKVLGKFQHSLHSMNVADLGVNTTTTPLSSLTELHQLEIVSFDVSIILGENADQWPLLSSVLPPSIRDVRLAAIYAGCEEAFTSTPGCISDLLSLDPMVLPNLQRLALGIRYDEYATRVDGDFKDETWKKAFEARNLECFFFDENLESGSDDSMESL